MDASITIEGTNYYYSGAENNLKAGHFSGVRREANFSMDVGFSAGVNAIYAPNVDGKGNFIVGIGPSVGVGVSPTLYSGNLNWGASGTDLRKTRSYIHKK